MLCMSLCSLNIFPLIKWKAVCTALSPPNESNMYYTLYTFEYVVSSNPQFLPSALKWLPAGSFCLYSHDIHTFIRISVGVWQHLDQCTVRVTTVTWIAIEMAINWLIYCVSCQGDPGNSGYTCNLYFLSVICLWLILGEEFSWKKSFNKARTIFSLSRQREGHHLFSCIYFTLIFIICLLSGSISAFQLGVMWIALWKDDGRVKERKKRKENNARSEVTSDFFGLCVISSHSPYWSVLCKDCSR